MAAPQRANFNTDDNLTMMVVQFMAQRDHFATSVAPVKMSSLESGKFSVKDFDLMRQQVLEKIGDDGEARELQSKFTQRNYACIEEGGRRTVTRTKARRSALVGIDATADAMEDLLEATMHTLDQAVSDTAFKTDVWGKDVTGVAGTPGTDQFKQWDESTATIIKDIEDWIDIVKAQCGEKPNQLVMGLDVWRVVKNNSDILDRIKHTQRGVVTEELIAQILGIEQIRIAETTYNEAARGQDPSIKRWLSNQCLLHKVSAETGDQIKSSLCTAEWGDPSIPRGVDGVQTRQWPSYEKDGTVHEVRIHYDVVLASKERGLFADDVLST